jgi:hypothetical protein
MAQDVSAATASDPSDRGGKAADPLVARPGSGCWASALAPRPLVAGRCQQLALTFADKLGDVLVHEAGRLLLVSRGVGYLGPHQTGSPAWACAGRGQLTH